MAKSVDMVNLFRVAAARGVIKQDPHFWMWLMIKESTAHSMECLGNSAERYQHRPVCSTGFKVVSFRRFIMGRVFLER